MVEQIPLLVYLTDFVVTGVLGPAVVDIFNNDSVRKGRCKKFFYFMAEPVLRPYVLSDA